MMRKLGRVLGEALGIGCLAAQVSQLTATVVTYRDREAQEARSLVSRLDQAEETVAALRAELGGLRTRLEEGDARAAAVAEAARTRSKQQLAELRALADLQQRQGPMLSKTVDSLAARLNSRLDGVQHGVGKNLDWLKAISGQVRDAQGPEADRFNKVLKLLDWTMLISGQIKDAQRLEEDRFSRVLKVLEWTMLISSQIKDVQRLEEDRFNRVLKVLEWTKLISSQIKDVQRLEEDRFNRVLKVLEWTKLISGQIKESERILRTLDSGETIGKEFAKLSSKVDGLSGQLTAEARARAIQTTDQERRRAALAQDTARAMDMIIQALHDLVDEERTARGDSAVGDAGGASRLGLAFHDFGLLKDQPATDEDDRRFGLRSPSPDPEIEGLLSMGQFLQDDPAIAGALSAMTGKALRTLFPQGLPQIHTIHCRSGLDLDVDASDIYAAGAVFGRIQEANDFAMFMQLVEPGAVVVDVGANFGLFAAHAALYAGPGGKVFAFEPVPQTYELLVGNIRRNGLEAQCTVSPAAVAAKRGKSLFHVASDSAFSGLKDTRRSPILQTLEIPVVALDAYAPLKTAGPVDLLKIDVEGAEGNVLAGARDLISRSPEILIMLEFSFKNLDAPRRKRIIEQLGYLEGLGFAIFARDPATSELARAGLSALSGKVNENLFVCRPEGARGLKLRSMSGKGRGKALTPEQAATLALLRRAARP